MNRRAHPAGSALGAQADREAALPRPHVCFVTDGSEHLGLGHVQQSTTFAQVLAPQAMVRFLTKSDDAVAAKIRARGFEVTQHDSDSDILAELQGQGPDIVIFDKLDVAEELARDVRKTMQARLVIFTNLTRANRHAHVAVSADIGSRFENVRVVDGETGTLYLYGPRYWVLRPEFYEYWRRGKPPAQRVARVLLIFGGSDPANLTSAVLDQLLSMEAAPLIDVVLGAHFHHDVDLREVLRRHAARQANVTVRRDIPNVAELMYAANLVIASPGLSAFEALRVGTPVIVVPHDALQRETYNGFMRMLDRTELARLPALFGQMDFTYPDDPRVARMEIGEGVSDLKELIMAPPEGEKR
ncbi:MAG: hypothetical protein NDI84_03170 [Steroidobacteraceae bacterium]|nr:hypothetical protein [Steroidobacteraceae bacterium]